MATETDRPPRRTFENIAAFFLDLESKKKKKKEIQTEWHKLN